MNTRKAVNSAYHAKNQDAIHRFFERQCLITPDAIAVTCKGEELTYAELNNRANRLSALIAETDNPGRLTGICLERSIELVVAVLAILKTGHAYVPFDPEYPQERLAYMMEISKLPLLITSSHLKDRLPSGHCRMLVLDELKESTGNRQQQNPEVDIRSGDLAYVLFTSGSTGLPKGVAMTHGPLFNLINWQQAETNLGTAAKTLQFAPISFDF